MHRPQTRTKRAPTVRPQNLHTPRPEADRRPRSGPITNQQKFVCNTKERAEFFGHASGATRQAPRRAAHAWQRSERRKLQGPASFGRRDIGERMGAGAPVASGRVRLGRKTGDVLPRSGRTGGPGPTFKKILAGLLTFDIYEYIFIYTGAMLRPENKRGPLCGIRTKTNYAR